LFIVPALLVSRAMMMNWYVPGATLAVSQWNWLAGE